jgi:hypothetical protein
VAPAGPSAPAGPAIPCGPEAPVGPVMFQWTAISLALQEPEVSWRSVPITGILQECITPVLPVIENGQTLIIMPLYISLKSSMKSTTFRFYNIIDSIDISGLMYKGMH